MSTIANLKINVVANTKRLSKGLMKARGSVITFKGAIKKLSKGLAVIGFAAAAAGVYLFQKALRSIITTFSTFEHAMQEVRSILIDISDVGFAKMTEKAKELGATTVFTATEAAKAMSFLSRAGFDSEETMAAVGSTLDLAAAGNLELAEAADITAQVLRGMGLEVSETTRVADVLALTSARTNTTVSQLGAAFGYAGPTAAALGITLEETAAMLGMLSNAGIQADRAGTGLKNIMAELAAEIDANGISALKRFTEGGIGVEEAFAIFQKRGGPAILALEKMSDRTSELTDELNGATNIANKMAKIRMESLVGQLELLRSKTETLKIEIGERLKPTLSAIVESLDQMTRAGTEAFDTMVANGRDSVTTVETLNKTLLKTLKIIGWVVTIGGHIGNFIVGLWNVLQVLMGGVVMVGAAVMGVVMLIIGALDALFHWDASRLQGTFDVVKSMFHGLGEGIAEDFKEGSAALNFEAGLGAELRAFVDETEKNLEGVGDTPVADALDPEVQAIRDQIDALEAEAKNYNHWALRFEKIAYGASGKRTAEDKQLIKDFGGLEEIKDAAAEYRQSARFLIQEKEKLEESLKPKPTPKQPFVDLEAQEALSDATEDLRDFINESQFAIDTISMTSRQRDIEKAKIAGVAQAMIDEATALDKLLTKKEKELELTKRLESERDKLKESLKGVVGEHADTVKDLKRMFARGLINMPEFILGLNKAKKVMKEGLEVDVDTSKSVTGIQTALGTFKVAGSQKTSQKTLANQLRVQKASETHLKAIKDAVLFGKGAFTP